MERLTFEGNFCDIAMCAETRGGSFCEDGACSYDRNTGYFNKVVSYYANKYNVSEEEVAKYVRMAQSEGQKEANKNYPNLRYYWFAVEYSMGNERNGACYFERSEAQYAVKRGLTEDTVKRRMSAHDDYISEYSPCHWFGRIAQFDTREEAEQQIMEWQTEK